jgi:hypothetical protein
MSDDDLLIKPPKIAPKRINWDRTISIAALVISIIAAVGTVWQARIAEQARKDVLALAQDRPILHISDPSLRFLPFLNEPHAVVQFFVKNSGRAAAKGIQLVTERHTVVSGNKPAQDLLSKPKEMSIGEFLAEGQEISASPLGVIKYSPNDSIRMSGRIFYQDEKGKVSQLPWCYEFIVPPSPGVQTTLVDCIGLLDPEFDSKPH